MGGMDGVFRFSVLDVLRLTAWIAVGCLVSRVVFIDLGLRPEHLVKLAAVLLFILTPFAAVGAMFDRMGLGILSGIAVVAAFAVFSLGAH
jgi:hypothetical protein